MKVLFLAPQWGFEHLCFEAFLNKILAAGFDGIDTWVPQERSERKAFINLLSEHNVPIVCHQHQAHGGTIKDFCRSFEYQLELCLECAPVMINSHSGRDYFSLEDKLRVIDTAQNFSVKNNIVIAHETHRGRIGYSPYEAKKLFALRPEMKITADFSHWTCVTESYLEHGEDIVNDAIAKTAHVHARVGFPQGPQVSDPRAEEWRFAEQKFMRWWSQIIEQKRKEVKNILTITPEFGPPPYMPTNPKTKQPLSDQFEINTYVMNNIKSKLLAT